MDITKEERIDWVS